MWFYVFSKWWFKVISSRRPVKLMICTACFGTTLYRLNISLWNQFLLKSCSSVHKKICETRVFYFTSCSNINPAFTVTRLWWCHRCICMILWTPLTFYVIIALHRWILMQVFLQWPNLLLCNFSWGLVRMLGLTCSLASRILVLWNQRITTFPHELFRHV